MQQSICISIDDRMRIIIEGLSPREMHGFISDLLNYLNEKVGEDREIVLFEKKIN